MATIFNFISSYKIPLLLLVFTLYSGGLFYGGWSARVYYDGYQEAIELKLQKVIDNGITRFQREQAAGLANTQQLMEDTKKSFEGKEKTIIERQIYKNVCFDQEGVDTLIDYHTQLNNLRENRGNNEK